MVGRQSPYESGGSIARTIVLGAIIVALAAAIVIGAAVRAGHPSGRAGPPQTHGTVRSTAPAAAVSSAAAEPDEDKPDPVASHGPDKAPSTALVIRFEQAYNTPDPTKRRALLAPLATPQYLADFSVSDKDKTDGLTVTVNPDDSTVTKSCDTDSVSCYVVTQVALTSTRAGKKVNSFLVPLHATEWLNTPDGWRVASETAVR